MPESLEEYYSNSYSLCNLEYSFLASWQGLAYPSHVIKSIAIPIEVLTVYIIITKTPIHMKSLSIPLLVCLICQILRKTCCDLRNYVDDVQLRTHMTSIRITVHSEAIYLHLEFDDEENKKYQVGYQKNRDGCCVRRYDPEKTSTKMIRNANFLTIFREDLRVILNQQASLLRKFDLTFEHYNFENQNNRIGSMELISAKIIDSLDKILRSRRIKFQVEEFEIEIMDQTRIPSILSHIDSRKLKKITLASAELRAREPLKIEELEDLDQWKNAKVLEIYQFKVTKPIKSFLRFEEVNIVLETISEVDLLFLRQVSDSNNM
ncbi:hypothetical protein CAEBREN_28786 [Caenorhabditis brenneri]|uniref:DUF38 domain-containing protein n=1 Tax=Caenorhabditis brenneri TaxID=135651 RepID=G0PK68_CAEBE|nr:hypothetical protein CAEBREN_28786 [Caenorhabditis brenneri]